VLLTLYQHPAHLELTRSLKTFLLTAYEELIGQKNSRRAFGSKDLASFKAT
jgi:hypothetical protein